MDLNYVIRGIKRVEFNEIKDITTKRSIYTFEMKSGKKYRVSYLGIKKDSRPRFIEFMDELIKERL